MDINNLHITLDLTTLIFARKYIMESVNTLDDPFARQQLLHGCQYAIDLLTRVIESKGYKENTDVSDIKSEEGVNNEQQQ